MAVVSLDLDVGVLYRVYNPKRHANLLVCFHIYPQTRIDGSRLDSIPALPHSEVSNWCINARVRLWKPMVEKYKEEFGGTEMDSNSSSENAPKGRYAAGSSEDRGDLLQSRGPMEAHEALGKASSLIPRNQTGYSTWKSVVLASKTKDQRPMTQTGGQMGRTAASPGRHCPGRQQWKVHGLSSDG